MSRHSVLCRDIVWYVTTARRALQHDWVRVIKVLCRDSEALCCIMTRLDVHDRDALSRQTLYSGKKIKK